MQTTKKTKWVYSVFSGTLYEVLEEDLKHLDVGQLPLKDLPRSSCKKCYQRFSDGRDATNYTYSPCSCLRKLVDVDIIKSLENFRTNI